MSAADNTADKIAEAPRCLTGDEEIRSGAAAMTESPLFTCDPDHAEFRVDNLTTLRAEVHDFAAEIRRATSSHH
jgi:hypothetical protein